MNSELFAKLPPTQLFFKCAVPAVVTSVFGALYSVVDGIFVGRFLGSDALAATVATSLVAFPVFFLFVLTGIFGLNGVWLMPTVAGLASGILTLGLVKTLKLKVPRTMLPESSP